MKNSSNLGLLRGITLVVLLASAVGSLVLMFYAGRYQKSILLIILFTGWVLSPFVVLLVATLFSSHWAISIRKPLYLLALLIAVASLAAYSVSWTPPGTKTAFKWLVVPLASWVIMLIVIPAFRRILRKKA